MEKDNKQIVEEGLAMFLVNHPDVKIEEVYFESCLPDKYKKYSNLSGSIIKLRNVLIILTFVEIAAAIWGFSYYFLRRSIIYIIVNVAALLLSVLGVFSSIYVLEIGLIIYGLLTTALPGTFFIYQIFELFAVQDTSYDKSKRLNDNILLLVFSLPYLYDFSVGIVTIVFMSRIANFNGILQKIKHEDEEAANKLLKAEVDKLNEKYSYDHLKKAYEMREDNLRNGNSKLECIVCMSNPMTMVNKPCNHVLMCESCSNTLVATAGHGSATCPKCRTRIDNFEKVFIS